MKQILLIDREFGAGGSTIGEKLAARLDWKLFDQALSQEIARLAKIPVEVCQRRIGTYRPVAPTIGQCHLAREVLTGTCRRPIWPFWTPTGWFLSFNRSSNKLRKTNPASSLVAARRIFSATAPTRFRVFLYASRELKFRRVLKRVGNETEAIDLVDSMDEDRRKFVKHHFGHDWPNRQLFHAMLNTGIGDDKTVETILNLLNAANRKEEAGKA